MRVLLGGDDWYLCDADDPPDPPYREFQGSETYALQLLGHFRGDGAAIDGLHRLWSATSADRLTDDELLRQISWWLDNGTIRARQPIPPVESGGGGVTEKQAAFPLERRRQPGAPSPGTSPEGPSFPDDVDPTAIAAVLKEAAAMGVPFCEECVKAQRAQQGGSTAP
jgi:hypothetical protein